MSHPLEVDDGSLELSMSFSGDTAEITNKKFRAVHQACQKWRDVTNVKEFSVVEVAPGVRGAV